MSNDTNNIKVTMQKNVLVRTNEKVLTMTHRRFIQWLSDNNVSDFVFRPGDKGDSIAVSRANSIRKAGYTVAESGEVHHYMKANLA